MYMLKDFDFDLPQALIADHPLDRGQARLLHRSIDGQLTDMKFSQICDLLEAGDVLVLNNTRVIPSCLHGYIDTVNLKINLINRVINCNSERWEFLSKPRKKVKVGSIIRFSNKLIGIVIEKYNQNTLDVIEFFISVPISTSKTLDSERELSDQELIDNKVEYTKDCNCNTRNSITQVYNNSSSIKNRLQSDLESSRLQDITNASQGQLGDMTLIPISQIEFFNLLDELGEMPLPPYMKRSVTKDDQDNYQTVFSEIEGSVAAPTAGLHFSHKLLDNIKSKGVQIVYVTLHIGGGTFLPIRVEDIAHHKMHHEFYSIDSRTCEVINNAKLNNHRVIAVGTTVIRTLESAAEFCGSDILSPHGRYTDIFIRESYQFKIVDCLITNFHLPKSTLFILICAFIGSISEGQKLYQQAIDSQYRFFSYGDACFLIR